MPRHCTIVLATALLALAAACAQACPNHASKSAAVFASPASHFAVTAWRPHAWTPPQRNAPSVSGLRVAVDPIDGTLTMPTPEQMLQLGAARSQSPVITLVRSDGSVRATLDESFQDHAVATLGENGKPAWTCVHGTDGAARFLKHPLVPAASAPRAPAPGTVWEAK